MRILIGIVILAACGIGLYALWSKPPLPEQDLAPPRELPLASAPLPPKSGPTPIEEPKRTAYSQDTNSTLDLGAGIEVHWSPGTQELFGRVNGRDAWSLETDFHIADVRKGSAVHETILSGADGLTSLRLDARTGKILEVKKLGSSAEQQAPSAELAALLSKAKATYADAQKSAKEVGALQEKVKLLFDISNQLSAQGRQTEAFKVWTVAKKLQKSYAPQPSPIPSQPANKPKPPEAWEDLEF